MEIERTYVRISEQRVAAAIKTPVQPQLAEVA